MHGFELPKNKQACFRLVCNTVALEALVPHTPHFYAVHFRADGWMEESAFDLIIIGKRHIAVIAPNKQFIAG